MNTYDRRHVDDRTAFLAHHDRRDGMDEVERRLQVDSNHGIPLLLGHTHHQSILGDTSIVDENVNTSKLLVHFVDHFFGLCEVGSIAGIALRLYAQSSYFHLCFFVLFKVCKRNISAFCGKFQCDTFPDSTGSSRNQSRFSS